MDNTVVFNITMGDIEQVSDRTKAWHKAIVPDTTESSLEDIWDTFEIAPIKTYELDPDCTHHFLIPTSGKDIVTGECKKCEGRKEFKNTFESVLKHHDPMIDRELNISALQDIKEPDLEKNYVEPLKAMLEFDSVSPSLS